MAKIGSTEDGNLQFSRRVVKELVYSDFDLTFAARTTSDGDVFKKTDAAAVKQAVKTIVLTNQFEKPYRPNFGANLRGLLFELADEDTGEEIYSRIVSTLERYEPRVRILSLKAEATPDYNSVDVTLEFRIVDTGIIDVLKVAVSGRMECETGFQEAPIAPEPGDRILTEGLAGIQTEAGFFLSADTGP